jgi:hypothetical protein
LLATTGWTGCSSRGCWSASHYQSEFLACSTCSLLIIIIAQVLHGMRGHYSRLPMPSTWCYTRHV